MKIRKTLCAGAIASIAGMAFAQPTVDGVYDAGTESSFYSDLIWVNNVPTGFGDNSPGLFTGGDFGNPEVVSTGIELSVPLASLGLTGTETIRIAGWVNSGDRTFKANQIVGFLPVDTGNLGGAQDFNDAPLDTTTQHIEIDLSSVASGAVSIDGQVDGGVGGSSYTNAFLQGNYTGFGNETDGTVDGSGPNGGGSEIDGIYIAKDATNLYIFVAGNLEGNGNAIDLYIDTGAGGSSTLGSGSGDGSFIVDSQSGLAFDSGFDADYVLSIDAWNDDDDDGTTPNVPRAWFGAIGGNIDDLGSLAGYGGANAGALSSGISMGIDNSNIEGVTGDQSESTPVSPDAAFDTGFEADYWININNGVDGGSGNLFRYTDAATLRTNGANIDPFFGLITDYGSFDGGDVADFPTGSLFEGPRIDIQDGALGSLFANYGPRLSELDPFSPIPGLLNVDVNNSNVGGVTDTDASDAGSVTTGMEICIDLDELGWDGEQDILVTGWIANDAFNFISNQVLGGIPGPDNIGSRDADDDGMNDLDFSTIAGDQYLNLSNPTIVVECLADLTGDGSLNFFDVSAFLTAFGTMDPIADFTGDGSFNFFDVSAFLTAFGMGCP